MNERIKELVMQATYTVKGANGCVWGDNVSLEKFSELIVKECVTKILGCHLAEGYNTFKTGDFELGYQKAIDTAASQVSKYFGVR